MGDNDTRQLERLENPTMILERISDGFFALDEELRVIYFNRAAEEQLRISREKVVGHNLFDAFPEARGSVLEENYRAAIREKKAMAFETYFSPRNEWYEVRVAPGPAGIYVYFRVITDRKFAEQALRESQEALRTVFDSNFDAILLHQPDGRIVDFNQKFLRLYEVSPEVAVRLGIADISDPAMPLASSQEIWDRVLQGQDQFFEWRARRYSDGLTFPVEVFLCRVRLKSRDLILTNVRDISERKRTEKVLRESEERSRQAHELLREVIEGSHDFIAAVDKEGHYILFNTAYQQEFKTVFGIELQLGMNIGEALAGFPEDRQNAMALLERALLGEAFRVTRTFGDPFRARKTYDLRISPIRNAGGELAGTTHIVRDISERVRMEEALRKSEERYRLVADFTHNWEYWLDPQARYLYVSPSCENITGYPPSSFQKDPEFMFLLLHPQDRDLYRDHKRESLKEGAGTITIEFRIVDRQGAEHWIEHVCQPVYGSDGTFLGRRGSNRDISDRKRAEEERERLIADLARSNQELEQFAYVASHDLQTPLRTITGFLELLARRYQGRLGPEADEYIAFAVGGAERMQQLINDILAFSRVGTRGKPFEYLESREPLERALDNLQACLEESRAEVRYDELPLVTADRNQLVQLFQNLVGNAIKYHNPGEPARIHIAATEKEASWEFRVADNGIGIHPDQQERIFQIFQRLHTEGEYPGTGIGLAICRKIVERHGGRIWVESKPGKGSTFYFTLPKA